MNNDNNQHNQQAKHANPFPREGFGDGAVIERKLEFDEVRTLLKGHCISKLGTDRVEEMTFMTDAEQIRSRLAQVNEIGQILDTELQMPGEDFCDMRLAIKRIRVEGVYLEESEMWELKRSLETMHSWIRVIRNEESPYPALSKMAEGVFTFYTVTQHIESILDRFGHVKDGASQELLRLRRELRRTEGSVSRTLNSILDSAKQEGLIEPNVMPSVRDGRLVIPVAPALKRRIRGIVHGESASGKTIFVEPAAVVEANNNLRELEAEEKREVIRILQSFTDILRPNIPELLRAYEFLGNLELALAKQRFAQQIGAVIPEVKSFPLIDWTQARHPLLEMKLRRHEKKVVPLDITLTAKERILIISGPNAGGKSVCLKTVGLLQYMLQCGLPIPLDENSHVGIFNQILIDIGDEQSIADDLSTYSSHLLNMKQMMRLCNTSSLLLIDEFGGGTEPTIGGALAEAMLRCFVKDKTYAVITTHYQNLKQFADNNEGVINGSMLYDRQQMQALFRLEIGHPGSSFAIEIARKIGIPEDVIADASEIVGKEYINADRYLLDIARDKRYWENKRQNIHQREKDIEKTISRYEAEIADLQRQRKEIIANAKQQAEDILSESNAVVENTIREIKEAQAEKSRTRQARQELNEFRTALSQEEQEKSDAIDRKMQQILARKQRQEQRKNNKPGPTPTPSTKSENSEIETSAEVSKPSTRGKTDSTGPFSAGASVRMKGQTTTGTIEQIKGRKAIVMFGLIRTTLPLDMLEPATKPSTRKEPQSSADKLSALSSILSSVTSQIHKKQLSFRQEIDVRGMRGDEALQTITAYIDDAILVGAARVRILHGTGNGILRQLIRQYLNTVPQIKSAHDEHVQLGGAGITIVELE